MSVGLAIGGLVSAGVTAEASGPARDSEGLDSVGHRNAARIDVSEARNLTIEDILRMSHEERVSLADRHGAFLAPSRAEDFALEAHSLAVQLPVGVVTAPVLDGERFFGRAGIEMTSSTRYLIDQYGLSVEDAVRQVEAEVAYESFAEWVGTTYENDPRYTGMWIDHSSGAAFTLAGPDAESLMLELGERLGGALPPLTAAFTDASHSELEGTFNEVTSSLDTVDSDGRLGSGIADVTVTLDERDGVVRVELISSAAPNRRSQAQALRDRLRSSTGRSLVEILYVDQAPMDRGGEACPKSGCTSIRGGIHSLADGESCSLGFTIHIAWNGSYNVNDNYVTSAGHCAADNGDAIRHGSSTGPVIGTQGWERDAGNTDASIINDNSSTMAYDVGNIWRPSNSSWPVFGKHTHSGLPLGYIVCRVGYNTQFQGGETCGELISKQASRSGNTNLGRIEHAGACPGDSGGSVFRDVTHYATGMHVTSTDSQNCVADEDSYFAFFTRFEDDYNWIQFPSSIVLDTASS